MHGNDYCQMHFVRMFVQMCERSTLGPDFHVDREINENEMWLNFIREVKVSFLNGMFKDCPNAVCLSKLASFCVCVCVSMIVRNFAFNSASWWFQKFYLFRHTKHNWCHYTLTLFRICCSFLRQKRKKKKKPWFRRRRKQQQNRLTLRHILLSKQCISLSSVYCCKRSKVIQSQFFPVVLDKRTENVYLKKGDERSTHRHYHLIFLCVCVSFQKWY